MKRQTRFVSRETPKDIISTIETVAESMGLKVHTRGYKVGLDFIILFPTRFEALCMNCIVFFV